MTTELTTYEYIFDGQSIRTILYKGRPCWLAQDVGRWLEYQSPGRFADKMSGDWSDEFIEPEDYDVLRGAELKDFKALLQPTTENVVGGRASALVILYESGVDLALLKTNKPKGKKLRRFLKTQVLPQLKRTGRYNPRIVGRATHFPTRNDEQQAHWLKWLYQELRGNLFANEQTLACLAIQAAEAGSGKDLSDIRQTLGQVPRTVVSMFLDEFCHRKGRTKADEVYKKYRGWAWYKGFEYVDEGWFRMHMEELGVGVEVYFDSNDWYYQVTLKW